MNLKQLQCKFALTSATTCRFASSSSSSFTYCEPTKHLRLLLSCQTTLSLSFSNSAKGKIKRANENNHSNLLLSESNLNLSDDAGWIKKELNVNLFEHKLLQQVSEHIHKSSIDHLKAEHNCFPIQNSQLARYCSALEAAFLQAKQFASEGRIVTYG